MVLIDSVRRKRLAVTPEKRSFFRYLLTAANPRISWEKTNVFLEGLVQAADQFQVADSYEKTYRHANEALRDIFLLIADPKADSGKIRFKTSRLPSLAQDEVLRRVSRRFPALLGNTDVTWRYFCDWINTCGDEELIEKVQLLVATGRAWSLGQVRDNEERSAPHIEPFVLGQYRRLHRPDIEWYQPPPKPKGGRPALEGVDNLLRTLGLLWLEATGQPPEPIKGKKSPFVRMAGSVLRCLGIRRPENALRRFWSSIRKQRDRVSNIPDHV